MLTFYHSPNSRSTSIAVLIEEMGVADRIDTKLVTIQRQDGGEGGPDPKNPHPEGKVPYLTDGDDFVRERAAIILYLTDRFESSLGRPVGDPQRGAYLSWLVWYQGVLEPVAIIRWAGVDHPAITASLRDYDTAIQRLDETLSKQPYLLGQDYSAADLLCSGPFAWFGDQMPATPAIEAWVARCQDRDAVRNLAGAEGR